MVGITDKRNGAEAAGEGQRGTAGGGKYRYDDDLLVELLVEKQLTYARIAEQVGISESMVKQIACGSRRADLRQKMWDLENGLTDQARRLGAAYARTLISQQIKVAMKGEGDQARRAREFVLKYVQASRPARPVVPRKRTGAVASLHEEMVKMGLEAPAEPEDTE